MKNKVALLISIMTTAVCLTACRFSLDFFPDTQSSDVSTPPAGDIAANKASLNYEDLTRGSVYELSCTPSVGKPKLLIIPVWFTDSSSYVKEANKDKVKDDIEKSYFGSNSEVGWRSVKTFYEEESFGGLTLTGTVSEWYECGSSCASYSVDTANNVSGAPKTSALVKTATDWYFSNHDDERRNYDNDGDGYLDGVMLIYAAPDYGTLRNDNYTNLWAYCFWLQDPSARNSIKPGVNAFFWASYDFMYGKEVASSRAGTSYAGGDTSHCSLDTHTFIHEMGHMFGLEDYYDYSSNSYQPSGGFSMQDHNVAGHDPFSSFALGWGKAYIPATTIDIDLKPFSTSGEMILLSPNWNSYNSPFDEYLLLEYYTNEGLNEFDHKYAYMSGSRKQYPTGSRVSGIRVWHVDARLLYTMDGSFSASKVTTNPSVVVDNVRQRVAMMMSNTYDDGTELTASYCSVLGTSYANYNLLQLIRKSKTASVKPTDYFSDQNIFVAGDTFSMDTYSRQFVNSGKLNSKKDLGFTFTINACNSTYASISVTKV